METLLDGIPLDRVSTSMTINATASILLGLYVAVARRRGIAESSLSGTVQNDILKEYVARGTWIFPPAPSLRLVTDLFTYCAHHVPRWNPISISGYHMREAGATAAQELGFTFAHALEYARAAAASVNVRCCAVGMPCRCMNDLAKSFELSSCAAARVGPKMRRPAARNTSTMPAASGASGPTTVNAMPSLRAKSASASLSGYGTLRRRLSRAVPPLPGAT